MMSPFTILYVENDLDDASVFQQAVAQSKLPVRCFHVWHPPDALAYLSGSEPFVDRYDYPLPGLILLSLNPPGEDSFEVLQRIRDHPNGNRVPLSILSESDLPQHRARSQALGASGFFVKSDDWSRVMTAISELLPVDPI